MNTKIITSVIVAMLLSHCIDDVPAGKMRSPSGAEARAADFPVRFTSADNIDPAILFDAVYWWNDALSEHWEIYCKLYIPSKCDYNPTFLVYTSRAVPFIVRYGPMKNPKHLGIATNYYHLDGRIKSSTITLREGSVLNPSVLYHELGHGAFGLAHASCDRNNEYHDLMCLYNARDVVLTEHEAYLIFDDLLEIKDWEYSDR